MFERTGATYIDDPSSFKSMFIDNSLGNAKAAFRTPSPAMQNTALRQASPKGKRYTQDPYPSSPKRRAGSDSPDSRDPRGMVDDSRERGRSAAAAPADVSMDGQSVSALSTAWSMISPEGAGANAAGGGPSTAQRKAC